MPLLAEPLVDHHRRVPQLDRHASPPLGADAAVLPYAAFPVPARGRLLLHEQRENRLQLSCASRRLGREQPQAHWKHRIGDQPFFAVFNLTTTHECQHFGEQADRGLKDTVRQHPAKATAPAILPRHACRAIQLVPLLRIPHSDGQAEPVMLNESDQPGSLMKPSSSSSQTTAVGSRAASAGSTTPACACR